MSSSADLRQTILAVDLYRPCLTQNPGMRINALLRRAQSHHDAIEKAVTELHSAAEPVAQWLDENEHFIQDKKLRLDICLEKLEEHCRQTPEAPVKAEVEMLRSKHRFVCQVFRERATNNVPCTDPARKAKARADEN
ncbi:hypothetical protein E8E13_010148 [Curvularia kusanoi]|uniref:Uncharacterized protein n=1 Tax=Curvularia kusanoi TaxID=90978 RepID=A0A9P4TJA2_CURKU|nr:hypothetical protein E8E13_010148 [Curvularia kusanoi]